MSTFDACAAGWEDTRRRERALSIAEEIRISTVSHQGGRALDFGCGTGLISCLLAGCFREIRLLDLSEGMLAQARQSIHTARLRHLLPARHNLLETPWPEPGGFDVVFSSMALHHVAALPLLFSRFGNLLRPGGLVCLVDLTPVSAAFHQPEPDFEGSHGFKPAAFAQMLEDAGFSDVKTRVFYQGEKPAGADMIPYGLFRATGVLHR